MAASGSRAAKCNYRKTFVEFQLDRSAETWLADERILVRRGRASAIVTLIPKRVTGPFSLNTNSYDSRVSGSSLEGGEGGLTCSQIDEWLAFVCAVGFRL